MAYKFRQNIVKNYMQVAHKPAAVKIKAKVQAQLCQYALSFSSLSKYTHISHSI